MKAILKLASIALLVAVVSGCSIGFNFITSDGGRGDISRSRQVASLPLVAPDVGRYIVVLKDTVVDVPHSASAIAAAFGATPERTYSHALKGFAATLPVSTLPAIQKNPLVAYVEPDIVLYAVKPGGGKPPKPPPGGEETPWGVDRIDADKNAGPKGSGVAVAVLDTGIDTDHKDLKANYKGGYNATRPGRTPEDDNGHGTHVSGIIAADNNGSGIVGVAPDAGIVAVKVLDRYGSGYLSWIIGGIDWVIANKSAYDIAVANMSFGGYGTSDSLHTAIQNLYNAGVTIAAAAGNDYSDAGGFIPASYPEVLCVSALDPDDTFASYSNWGSVVDLIAPGTSVKSCWLRGGYATASGTSMAAPHVAGSAALWLDDHNGTPEQVMDALIAAGESGSWPGDPDGIDEPLVDAETL